MNIILRTKEKSQSGQKNITRKCLIKYELNETNYTKKTRAIIDKL